MQLPEIIKIIIAEDDDYCRRYIKDMLAEHADFEIIGEAVNGLELIELTTKLKPHAIIVDVEMPDLDGMTAVKTLAGNHEFPVVVFITGHADFAVEAFEISSCDYILKPYTEDRFQTAMERVRNAIKQRNSDLEQLSSFIGNFNKLYVKTKFELRFIDTDKILFIERIKNDTLMHCSDGSTVSIPRKSLSELRLKLDSQFFFRSHKSYLINLTKVERILPWNSSTYMVKFQGSKKEAYISRSNVQNLTNMLEIL